jgi:ABC-type branched-subunit amino acid transport system substrate-binding protein
MKRLLRASALGFAALAITSCATTNLVQVWRDPNYRPAPIKRVFVVAVIPHAQDRVLFENAIAHALINKGVEVATSSGIVPPDQSDNNKIVAYVKEMGVDLVVVLRLVTPYGTTDINVYAAKTNSEWPVWSGTSNTSNFSSAQEAATSVAASLLYGLVNTNILVR